jgi:uncharacterized repeat protein (TIGR01451 family)
VSVALRRSGPRLVALLAVLGGPASTAMAARPQGVDPVFIHEAQLTGRPEIRLGQPGERFGFAVAAEGDTAVVGAYAEDTSRGGGAGAVYVFVRSGTSWTEQQRLTAPDGTFGDGFGNAVALSGDTLVVGAEKANGPGGADAGAAYVFVRSGAVWSLQRKLIAPDGAALDAFGWSVAVSGDTVAVGADFDSVPAGAYAGSAYVFTRTGTEWSLPQKLVAPDGAAEAFFGASVALAGEDTLIVGADSQDHDGLTDAGEAYVFSRSGGTWTWQQTLTASDAAVSDGFGWSAAVSGDTLAVGAYQDSRDLRYRAGAVYVFVRSGDTWSEQAKLIAADPGDLDHLGLSVSVSGDTIAAGADLADTPGGVDSGAVYVFVRSGDAWSQQQKLVGADTAAGDVLSWVSLSGETLVAGADLADTAGGTDAGAAYVFVRSGTAWSEQRKLTASAGQMGEHFAETLALSGDTALIGSRLEQTAAGTSAGAAYVLVRNGSTWTEQQKLLPADARQGDLFGSSVALSGDTAAVTAAGVDLPGRPDVGAVYVFVRSGTTWTQQRRLTIADTPPPGWSFGSPLVLSGNTLVASSPFATTPSGEDNGGIAHVFVRSGTAWSFQQTLVAPDPAPFDYFAIRVAIEGDTVLAGSFNHDTPAGPNAGAAYVFVRSGTTWSLQQVLTASDAAANDGFGTVTSLSGDTALVGARGADTPAGPDRGAAYVFVRSGTSWTQQQKLTAPDVVPSDLFAFTGALSGDRALVGAYSAGTAAGPGAGAVYAFVRSGTTWSLRQRLVAPDGSPNDSFGQAISASGDSVLIGAYADDTVDGLDAGSAYVFRLLDFGADLAVSQTDLPDPAFVQQALAYTIAVTNQGPQDAAAVSVTDVLPEGVSFQAAGGDGWTCEHTTGQVTCTRPALAVGPAPPITVSVVPAASGSLANRVSVDHGGTDPNSLNDSDLETTTVLVPAADLSMALSDGGLEGRWGQPFTWTITARNAGPHPITGAIVADSFPPEVTSVTWTCQAAAGSSCPASGSGDLGAAVSLAAGGSATFTATGTVATGATSFTNTATIAPPTGAFDPDPANNSSTVTTAAGPIPDNRFYTVPPCRVVDTRTAGLPLSANTTRAFTVAGLCAVPADARAVAVNLVAVNPGDFGNLRLYPTGVPVPLASALNFVAGRTRANNAVVPLGIGGAVDVRCDMPPGSAASLHFVLDVYGYFR